MSATQPVVGRATNKAISKWQRPAVGSFKINVDASVQPVAQCYSVDMVLRDHEGTFMAGRRCCFAGKIPVMEAKAVGVREALSWIKDLHMQGKVVTLESDSQLVVNAILDFSLNLLEVGQVIESCRTLLEQLYGVSIVFMLKYVNKVVHLLARVPCVVNYCNMFTSPRIYWRVFLIL